MRLKRSGEVQSEFFNTRAATKVLIHGFGESSAANDMSKIKKAYLTVGDYNVLVVDWGSLAASPCYTTAKRNTNVVGRALGNLLDQLASSGADLGRVHLIGYSLGAQVAGIAGNAVLRGSVCRITGSSSGGSYSQ
ncbi:endothelial lipase-like [Anabrus simplex]|uniref:endothelial lipase-like n=1 Tax=Anabrus simplex TaxID=316456 RepID=UPI0034DDB718